MDESTQRVLDQGHLACQRVRLKNLGISMLVTLNLVLSVVSSASAYSTAKVIKVPIINQRPELPTGCEAASAAMLLRWAGITVSKEELARSLPKGSTPYSRENKLYGGNPNSAFIGDPFTKGGYGVYHRPIADVINKYSPGNACDITGISFDRLLRVIDSGKPVIVWCTINNRPPRVSKIWYDSQGNEVIWKIPEHAVVLVGYTNSHVIVNDPWTGKIEYYPISTFKYNFEYMGSQAVTVK